MYHKGLEDPRRMVGADWCIIGIIGFLIVSAIAFLVV